MAGLLAATLLAGVAQARTPERMMQDCRIRAHEVLHTRLPNIETKYEGQRTDGTHAVNGTAWIRGRTETFQCSFNRRGRRIVSFVINQHGGGSAGGDNEPSSREERVRFPSGQSGTELRDTIGPGASVTYRLRARKGQVLYVRLATRNRRTYFNIFTPDGGTLFESARNTNEFRGPLWLNGDHAIEVYNRSNRYADYNVIMGLNNRNYDSSAASSSHSRERNPSRAIGRALGAAIAAGLATAITKAAQGSSDNCARVRRSCNRLYDRPSRRYRQCLRRRNCLRR